MSLLNHFLIHALVVVLVLPALLLSIVASWQLGTHWIYVFSPTISGLLIGIILVICVLRTTSSFRRWGLILLWRRRRLINLLLLRLKLLLLLLLVELIWVHLRLHHTHHRGRLHHLLLLHRKRLRDHRVVFHKISCGHRHH